MTSAASCDHAGVDTPSRVYQCAAANGTELRLAVAAPVVRRALGISHPTAALLRTGQSGATWLDMDGFGGRMDLAFTGLAHTVRTGDRA
jgi:hypothetical protein